MPLLVFDLAEGSIQCRIQTSICLTWLRRINMIFQITQNRNPALSKIRSLLITLVCRRLLNNQERTRIACSCKTPKTSSVILLLIISLTSFRIAQHHDSGFSLRCTCTLSSSRHARCIRTLVMNFLPEAKVCSDFT